MRNILDKIVDEIKTRILCSVEILFPPKFVPVLEIMWKNVVEPDRTLMKI
jgi:hypothetical protein